MRELTAGGPGASEPFPLASLWLHWPPGGRATVRALYAAVFAASGRGQIRIAALTGLVTPLAFVPLELQRRMVEVATGHGHASALVALAAAYLGVIVCQGALKYQLNLTKGRVVEEVTRDLRRRVVARGGGGDAAEAGTWVSMALAEAEDLGGFAGDSVALPLLQAGTILWVLGYLLWIEWPIALLAVAIYAPQAVVVPRVQGTINRLVRMKTLRLRRLGGDVGQLTGLPPADGAGLRRRALTTIEHLFALRLMIYRRKYLLTALGNGLDAVGPLLILTFGGAMVLAGETDVATLVVFISGLQRVADPWDELVGFFRTLSTAMIGFDLLAASLAEREP